MKKRRRKKHHNRIWFVLSVLILLISFGVIIFFYEESAGRQTGADKVEAERSIGIVTEVPVEVHLPDILELEAGTVVENFQIDTEELAKYFIVLEIDDNIFAYINGRSYTENEQIHREDLRYLKVLHYNFDHRMQVGEIIVNVSIAEDVRNIFYELFEQEYEIESMRLIDKFWTGNSVDSDTNSIENNNTSAFNYRVVPGTKKLSNHAAGYAIDINPLQNPYVKYNQDGELAHYYKDMEQYMDRESGKPHMITHEDICYQIFTKYGFAWGGDWKSLKDYQHFEKRVD